MLAEMETTIRLVSEALLIRGLLKIGELFSPVFET